MQEYQSTIPEYIEFKKAFIKLDLDLDENLATEKQQELLDELRIAFSSYESYLSENPEIPELTKQIKKMKSDIYHLQSKIEKTQTLYYLLLENYGATANSLQTHLHQSKELHLKIFSHVLDT